MRSRHRDGRGAPKGKGPKRWTSGDPCSRRWGWILRRDEDTARNAKGRSGTQRSSVKRPISASRLGNRSPKANALINRRSRSPERNRSIIRRTRVAQQVSQRIRLDETASRRDTPPVVPTCACQKSGTHDARQARDVRACRSSPSENKRCERLAANLPRK